jgi:hypothetical protein
MSWPPSLLTRLVLLAVLAAISVWEPRLSLVAGFLTLVALVSRAVGSTPAGQRGWTWSLIALAFVLSTAGFFRFVMLEAIPGVIAGGRAAAEKHAVAYLRTIVAAQDYMRRSALIDPDHDKVGSAASRAELVGKRALRSGQMVAQYPLYTTAEQWLPGSAFVSSGAYLYRVCLPDSEGTWFDPALEDPLRVDDERAERDYLVYGWPKTWTPGSPTTVYVSDAYEAIKILDPQVSAASDVRYAGENSPPPCDAITRDPRFKVWNNKAPREQLPGAESSL